MLLSLGFILALKNLDFMSLILGTHCKAFGKFGYYQRGAKYSACFYCGVGHFLAFAVYISG